MNATAATRSPARPMASTERDVWIIHLRAEPAPPGGPTDVQGMRRLLKTFLRAYGFRCVWIERRTPPVGPTAQDALAAADVPPAPPPQCHTQEEAPGVPVPTYPSAIKR